MIGQTEVKSTESLELSDDRLESDDLGRDPGSGPKAKKSRWATLWPGLLCLAIYAGLAQGVYGYRNSVGSGHLANGAGRDSIQGLWFLAWPAYALSHASSLFSSNWMNYPRGVNLLANASMPGLGILASPITLIFGPVVTWNVLVRLALVVSAFSMCLALRRWTKWWPAAFVGGLFYGFSSFMLGQAAGHLYLTFVPLPPMIFLMLDEIMVRQRWRPSRAGLVLGLLCAGQFLISTEVFVTTLILGIAFVVVLAVTGHKVVRQRYRRVIRSLSYAAGIAALLLAYPLWFTFQGPAHVNGAPHSVQDLARYPGDLLGGVLPTELKRFGPSAMLQAGTQLTGGNVFENGMYLGLPLIVLLIAFVIYLRRNRAILVAGAMAFISYVLSLGPYLYIDGHNTRIVMPEYVLSKLGLLQDILAVRFSLFTALFTAAMLAIGLGELHQRWLTHSLRSRTSRLARWLVLVALIAAVGLPLLPRASYPSVATEIPPYFTTSSVHAIDEGDVALTYPYPGPVTEQAILAQAAAGMRFKVFGGYAFVPGDNGIPIPPPVAPPTVEQLFTAAYDSGTLPAPGAATNASIRSFLVHHHVGAIICEHVGSHPATVVNYISAVVGLPTTTQGVTVWLNVPERLRDAKAYPRARLPIDKTPPSTRILRPISGAVLKGHEWLAASASDEFGVAKVEFEFAGVGRPETIIDTAVPFSLGWLGSWNTSTVPNGTYTLRSVAIDPTGLTSASAGVVVTVGN